MAHSWLRALLNASTPRQPRRASLATPFRISRGVKTVADVVTVTLTQDGVIGRGECVPYPRYGESGESVIAQIARVEGALIDGASRAELQELLAAGAARNAVDCALWDLEAGLNRRSVGMLAGEPLPALVTALTVGLDRPEAMAAAAAKLADMPLIKVKVDAGDPEACLRAVRAAAPGPRMIVDPNESWDFALLEQLQPVLAELDTAFVEQPLPAEDDAVLEGFRPGVPVCDESCHTVGDLDRLAGRYGMINIKLDKTGGLTGALALHEAGRARGMGIMIGCMTCTSLSIAPALHIAARRFRRPRRAALVGGGPARRRVLPRRAPPAAGARFLGRRCDRLRRAGGFANPETRECRCRPS